MSTATPAMGTAIGVGLDTARYGHHVTFLREDRQLAAKQFDFLESRGGYQRLENALRQLSEKHPDVHFHFRVDAAGQYAVNLLAFLEQLPWPKTISVGEPARNKQYRQVHFPKRKADPTDSHACARFAIVERPEASSTTTTSEMQALKEVVSRLEFQVKQSTRQVNRLHNLLARVFPELAVVQNNLKARWVLRLLEKYPTAERIAKARRSSIEAIPNLPKAKAGQLHEAAKQSVAAEQGDVVEEVVRQSVCGLVQSMQAEKQLESLAVKAFDALSDQRAEQIVSIYGIGRRTAAVLVAKIGSIDRFPTADHLTSYFGVFPEEHTSGVDKQGKPIPPGTMRMSRKGNDLVRKHLWMAAMVASRGNPQIKALYARLCARGRNGAVALGHCMRKLLHQVFGVWTTGRAYDPDYSREKKSDTTAEPAAAPKEMAAGRKTGMSPQRKAVTATVSTIDSTPNSVKQADTSSDASPSNASPSDADDHHHASIDFPRLRSQITLERVLRHLGYFDRLRGRGPQRRGPCPVHGSKRSRGRTFSVHLDKNIFQCFHPPCGASGNVLDLWCQIHQLTPYEGAVHLAETFDLNLHPLRTEKRNP